MTQLPFIAFSAILAIGLGFWLRRALGRQSARDMAMRRNVNISSFRENLSELRTDYDAGRVTPDELISERARLEHRLLEEADTSNDAPSRPLPRSVAYLVLLSPLVLGGMTFALTDGAQHFRNASSTPDHVPDVEQMVGNLAARLQEQPDDAAGWSLLGRSYVVLERYPEAARAYQRANELNGDADPDLLVAEGETLGLARERDLLGRPAQLFDQALLLDANHIRALWYAGLAARQAGDDAKAGELFNRLREQADLPPELREILGPAASSQQAIANAKGPDETDKSRAMSGAAVRARIELDPALKATIDPEAALFVFARARRGPPMPLAVQRLTAGQLPVDVVLDDSMGMVEGMKLSSFDDWTLVARISMSGEAQAQPGDLQGQLDADPRTPQPIRIVIDERIQ